LFVMFFGGFYGFWPPRAYQYQPEKHSGMGEQPARN
jgi:hypothetical protein